MKNRLISEQSYRTTRLISLFLWHEHHMSRGGKIFGSYKELKTYVADNEAYLRDKKVLVPATKEHSAMVTSDFGFVVFEHLYG